MIDTNELRRLAQAATPGPWSVVEYDHAICVQTESPSKSKYGASRYAAIGGFDRSDQVQLEEARANARIIAAANPAAITELLDRLEAAEKERDALRAKIAKMEKQEPVGEIQRANSTGNYICSEVWVPLPVGAKLYALPGAQPAPSVPEAVMAALENLDDYIARIEGNDRGACNPINLIRRYLLDAAGVGGSK